MKFFKAITNLKELRKEYLKLCMMYHPDKHPADEEKKYRAIFQEINNEYEKATQILKSNKRYTTYDGDDFNEEKYSRAEKTEAECDEKLREILNKLLDIDCEIEVIGYWIWVSNTKKEDRERYSELGLRWSKNKKMWYFNPDPNYKRYGKKNYSIDEIRSTYGSAKVRRDSKLKIEG